jgi:hypothetical protein
MNSLIALIAGSVVPTGVAPERIRGRCETAYKALAGGRNSVRV